MKEKIKQLLTKYNFEFEEDIYNKFEKLMELVLQKNQEFNLTSITEENDFISKHILDSLFALKHITDGSEVIDIGSGAGFPALILKIANPTLSFTMIDSVRKKVDFLNFAIKELNLKDVQAVHARVEDFAVLNSQNYDFCTSRAVAALSTLLEYSLPFVKIGGKMIAYKGPSIHQEIENCEKSLKILGGKIENIIELNIEDFSRTILIVNKEKNTQKGYPRSNNKPRINPLN